MNAAVSTPDYRAMPVEDLDVSDPRMFQYDYWLSYLLDSAVPHPLSG